MPRTDATLARAGDALRFTGPLSRDAVAPLWRQAVPQLAGVQRFDLTAVTAIDSAGIALLAELAARCAAPVSLDGTPPGLGELRAAYRLAPDLGFAL
jgi:phospholipid transport system transporter-binding protein